MQAACVAQYQTCQQPILMKQQEYGGYVTDITRAWPVSGKFSTAQRDLYEMILGVQRQCVSLCRQSERISLDGLHSAAELGLKDGLKALGFDMSNNVSVPESVGLECCS